MPLQRGSVTFSRFAARAPAGDARRWLARGLAKARFEPLDRERGEEDRAAGFVEREDPDATGFAVGAVTAGEWALFAWRVDSVAVRASAVRAELQRWEAAFTAKGGRPPARAERAAARDGIRQELRKRTPPATRLTEVAWNLRGGELLVFSATRKLVDEIAAAVEGAFGAELTPHSAAALAVRAGARLERLGPTPELVGQPRGGEVAP